MIDVPASEPLRIASAFSPDLVVTIDPQLEKADVLKMLVKMLADAGRLDHEHVEAITATLLARERVGTTGLGKGLAFPHLRSPLITNFCGAIGTVPQGIDFDSLDRLPTRLVVLTLSPFEARSQHCEVLGRLCTLLSDRTLQYSLQTHRPNEELLSLLGAAISQNG